MELKTAVVWSLMLNKHHDKLEENEVSFHILAQITNTLFPGVEFANFQDQLQFTERYVMVSLYCRFTDLIITPECDIDITSITKITEMLPTNKLEWKTDLKWGHEFYKRLKST